VRKEQLEEILRAASALAARKEFVLFGSQTVHAITNEPPVEVLMSRECDVWLNEEPSTQELLKRELGAESHFQQAKGFYLDPVPPDLPLVPLQWQKRLRDWMIDDIRIRCLEIHDLIVSKLSAGRLKDYEFIAAVVMAKLARADEVARRIQTFPDPHTQAVLLARLRIATESTDVRL
jgi:Nucleotidyltransferase of unknown function (DUF6036)